MAEIVNDRDVLIMAAVPRYTPPTDRGMFLTPPAAIFRASADGSTSTPPSFTFKASLFNLAGQVSFAASNGAKLTVNAAANEATLDYAAYLAAGAEAVFITASITVDGVTHTQQAIVTKVADGAQGVDGAQTGVARLYQFSTAVPGEPAGSSTFTWAGAWNGSYTGTDGWSVTVPANPGTPGLRLYVASASVSAAAKATTTAVSYTGATVEAWSQNGAKGDTGTSGVQSGVATVYQWAATIPGGPAGNALFRWASNAFGEAPTGWALTPGAAPSLGMTLWAASVKLVDAAANGDTAFNWSSASIMAIGYAGTNGGPGQQGASYVTAYIASSAIAANGAPAPTTGRTSVPAANSSGLAGAWSTTVPTLTDGQRMYQSDGIYDSATDKVTWSIPYWSSLKVATLSAITANLGAITGGSMNIGNGKFTVDAAGNVTMSSFILYDPNTGKAILQAGGMINPDFLPASVKNSELVPSIQAAKDAADSAKARLDAISADSILDRSEKAQLVTEWATEDAVWAQLRAQANNLGVDYSNYDANHKATSDYLVSLSPGWSDTSQDTNIDRAYFRNRFKWLYEARQALQNAVSAKAATTSTWNGTAGRPEDVSSLVLKSNFDDGSMGKWQGVGTENKGGTGNEAIPHTRTLLTRSRDALEAGNVFPVTPNERIYFSVWLNTEPTNYRGGFGMFLFNAAGQVVGYPLPCTLPAGRGWTYIEGSVVIPDGVGVVNASPWLQQDGPGDGFANGNWLRAAGMWIGRHARGATVGADSGNLKVGAGRPNLLEKNTLPTDLSTFSSYYSVPGAGLNIARGADTFGVYSPGRRGAVWVHATGIPAAGTTVDIYRSDRVKIVPGQRYEFGVTLSTHRTTARIAVAWYDVSGNYITEHGGNDVTNSFWNIDLETPPSRSVLIITPPDAARSAMVFVRQVHYGEADPYTFASQWYAAEALAGQTEPSPYSASPLEARDLAESAQAGLADKLSQTAGGVMRGQITMQTSGAIVAGNASYSSAGFGGTGAVMSPYGFACVQNGVPKLSMAVDGHVYFAGELWGAYGNFGALRIAPGGSICSGDFTGFVWPRSGQIGRAVEGFYFGDQGLLIGDLDAARYLQIRKDGNWYAPGFTFESGQLTLTNPVIIAPKLQTSLNVSIPNTVLRNVNTSSITFGVSCTISGGVGGPYRYLWTFAPESGPEFMSMIGDPTAASARIKCTGSGWKYGYLSVTVYDGGGAAAGASTRISVQFGSAQEI